MRINIHIQNIMRITQLLFPLYLQLVLGNRQSASKAPLSSQIPMNMQFFSLAQHSH